MAAKTCREPLNTHRPRGAGEKRHERDAVETVAKRLRGEDALRSWREKTGAERLAQRLAEKLRGRGANETVAKKTVAKKIAAKKTAAKKTAANEGAAKKTAAKKSAAPPSAES